MSAGGGHGRKRGGGGGHGHDGPDERWLLTYADMITLLMALFIVMWSMSSVNISKFAALKASLTQAFNGKLSEGGQDVLNGAQSVFPAQQGIVGSVVPEPVSTIDPVSVTKQIVEQQSADADQADLENLARVKHELDEWSRKHGLNSRVESKIDERGLVIRVLTDDLLFDSGSDVVRPEATPLIAKIAELLRNTSRVPNPVRVEGNTDNLPISTPEFASNWELSTRRATAVLQKLLGGGMDPKRLAAIGYADQRPVASNTSASGRSLNRRVELVVIRRSLANLEGGT
ncbi:MAG: flagellar motor protein MotB [Gaiellales bacterium]